MIGFKASKMLENAYLKLWAYYDLYRNRYLARNFGKIFPKDKVMPVSSNDFDVDDRVILDKGTNNSFKICAMPELMEDFERIYKSGDKASLDRILAHLKPHLSNNNEAVETDNCVVIDLITGKGGYFPMFHTDVHYGIFPEALGFQVWYLVRNEKEYGNMYLLETNKVQPASNLSFSADGVDVISQVSNEVIAHYNSIDELDCKVKYTEMVPGDCLIMNGRLYHMSDIKNNPQRIALNFRVFFTESDGALTIEVNSPNVFVSTLYPAKLKARKAIIKDGKVSLGKYQGI